MFFFFNDPATTEIYTLSLHDALPIYPDHHALALWAAACAEHVLDLFESARPEDPRPRSAIEHARAWARGEVPMTQARTARSEEHTSELQSRQYLVCRLLLEKKKDSAT